MRAGQFASLAKLVGGTGLPLTKVLQQLRLSFVQHVIRAHTASDWLRRGLIAHEKRQYFRALMAWKRASELGDAEALYRVGLLYARGEGVVQSIPDAVAWYTRAALAGHVDAQFQLGAIYLNGSTFGQNGANNWFKSAKQRNCEAAQENLDVLFPNGVVIEKDLEAANRWIVAAARSGKAEAQLVLGEMCRRGLGMPQNYELARRWYLLAAKQGNASAQYGVGDIYYLGLDVPIDRKVGADWYEKAADQGDVRAWVALALAYLNGQGRPIDLNELRGCLFKQQRKETREACIMRH